MQPAGAGAFKVFPFHLPPQVSEKLFKLTRNSDLATYVVLLSVLNILLSRYNDGGEVIVGSPVYKPDPAAGATNDCVPLRSQVTGALTFKDYLLQVRQMVLEAYGNQNYPLGKILELLNLPVTTGRHPLFDIIVLLEGMHDVELIKGAGNELTFSFAVSSQRLSGKVIYRSDIDCATVERTVTHFTNILSASLVNPSIRIADLSLYGEEELRDLLAMSQGRRLPALYVKTVIEYFHEQVEKSPNQIAVIADQQTWTYAQLRDRMVHLARHMISLGVTPETLIAVFANRSPNLLAAMLAIFNAGGVYLPLDPAYPSKRVEQILSRSRARFVLSDKDSLDSLSQVLEGMPADQRPTAVVIEDLLSRTASENHPLPNCAPNQLAYIFYTSGSTGHPKGAMVEHRGMINHLWAKIEEVKLTGSDVVAQNASQGFDISVWQFLSALLVGGKIRIVRDEIAHDPRMLLEMADLESITILETVPALLAAMVEEIDNSRGEPFQLTALRELVVTGEALPPELCRRWLSRHPHVAIVNAYGATETSDDVTHYRITTPPAIENLQTPVGKSIANLNVYVLDRDLNPSPVRVAGEIYQGGIGVGRGYWDDPERTAEAFIPDLLSEEAGARMYKSGDLGRYVAGGNIEFLGRIDNQVKVRGHRIELGEIESALLLHPDVREAVVLSQEDATGDKRLVGYVILAEESQTTSKEIQQYVQDRLPEYMALSALVRLNALPLTPNGKIDRQALPMPEWRGAETGATFVMARTPIEAELTKIWAELLPGKLIGVYDNFFELGGHSLLATQVASRVRNRFQVEIALRHLFETPTIAGLAEITERAIRSGRGLPFAPIERVPRDRQLPLSFAQQRIWFLDKMEPGNPAYNIPLAVRLTGRLDLATLEQSLAEIVRRHEILRTTYTIVEGQPVQVIAPERPPALEVSDLSHMREEEQEKRAEQLAAEFFHRPFDLERGPALRACLLRLNATEHVFLLAIHHIAGDAWSSGVLVREIGALYEAFSATAPSPLPELPIQYADFAVWQRRWLQGEVLELQLAYWKSQLGSGPRLLELPSDRPRPAIQTYRGDRRKIVLSAALSDELRELSRREGATLFMTLLAAFKVFLYRYTGQADLCVGTVIAGRSHAEIEGLMGFFVNTLALRTDLSGRPTFREALDRVREVTLGAYAHQDLPFEKLVEELQPQRDLSHAPLFQVAFTLQESTWEMPNLPDLNLSEWKIETNTAKFDLTLAFAETTAGITGTLEYSLDLFESSAIDRMLNHFQLLLAGVVANPSQRISDLPILASDERQVLLEQWNDTRVDCAEHLCVHQLFEAHAARRADDIAVVFDGEKLTYGELNGRANQLANYLKGLGVGPEVFVGVYLERSLDTVISFLGILKAGGGYLPLDPASPHQRLVFVLEDARPAVLLTHGRLAARFPEYKDRIICMDRDWELIARADNRNPISSVTGRNLAYIIYTSGSTGRPKGALLEHDGLRNLSEAQIQAFGLEPDGHVLQFASPSFDASVWEILMALLRGATLHLAKQEDLAPGPALIRSLRDRAITNITLPPSVLAVLPEDPLPRLRTVITAGEVCSSGLVSRYATGRRFINAYGPTEATVCATIAECVGSEQKPPIGRPISNVQIYLLDEQLQPAPVGVPGELCIGGMSVARGYLKRPELTAESFIPHPFSREPGARLYRTGDQARYQPDGNIDFIGRIDQQVKWHGYRIELGEIEAMLKEFLSVSEAAVVTRESGSGDARLVAYVVPEQAKRPVVSGKEGGGSGDPGEPIAPEALIGALRDHLKKYLPHYMAPSAFVILDAMPLTPAGKIDRRMLPEPDNRRDSAETLSLAPRTAMERAIAALWQETLNLKTVGINDNFFDLGGHSLLMAQIHSRLYEVVGREVSIIDLFKYPTVSSLAEHLARLEAGVLLVEPGHDREKKMKAGIDRKKQLLERQQAAKEQSKRAIRERRHLATGEGGGNSHD
jgi:amino acid adenylation domain-containing protein